MKLRKLFPLAISLFLAGSSFAAETKVETQGFEPTEVQQGQIGKIRLMSNNNIPKKVIVVRNSSTASFVDALIETVKEINEQSDIMDLKVHVIVGSSWSANSFQSEMEAKGYYGSLVEINDQFYTSDQWMQDWGEIGVAHVDGHDTPQMLILDSNRGRGLKGLPKIFAKMWNAYYLKNPSNAGIKGDYGGNTEVTPDNVLVLGTTSTNHWRGIFNDHGYKDKRVLLDTDWLQVGHVDEYVSFVPNPAVDGGYTIIHADPGLAFDLIKNASEEELNATNPEYKSTIRSLHEDLNSRSLNTFAQSEYDLSEYKDILKWKPMKRDGGMRQRLSQLVDLNYTISDLIDRNIVILKDAIKKITNTPDRKISVVSLPTIFRGRKSGSSLYRCVALLPGVVNMLVLGNHLVIPDAQMPMLNHYITGEYAKLKLNPHFLNDMAYHNLAGEIHCGTNVIRYHDKYLTYPDHIILKRKFKQLFGIEQ